jgi:hypothetical protein
MRHRQNGEFEAHVVDFNQFTEPNMILHRDDVSQNESPAAA